MSSASNQLDECSESYPLGSTFSKDRLADFVLAPLLERLDRRDLHLEVLAHVARLQHDAALIGCRRRQKPTVRSVAQQPNVERKFNRLSRCGDDTLLRLGLRE